MGAISKFRSVSIMGWDPSVPGAPCHQVEAPNLDAARPV